MALMACGGSDGKSADAAQSACGADVAVTGAVVDWDSTDASFCGVNGATLHVSGGSAQSSATPPNGRITMCIPHAAQSQIDVTLPTGASQCPSLSGQPNNTYTLPASLITTDAVLGAAGAYDVRLMTAGRVMTMFTGGAPVAGRGQLMVHVNGTPREVAISAPHDPAQRFDGTSWAAGTTGADVFFPNIDLTANPVTVMVTGATGTGAFSLQADKLTILSVIAN
jgi:hypothetical protein